MRRYAWLAGMLLNYALFLCTLTNSALTTTVVGVLKGVASTLLGFFLLGKAVQVEPMLSRFVFCVHYLAFERVL